MYPIYNVRVKLHTNVIDMDIALFYASKSNKNDRKS
jgi:hypothetical protein